MWLNIDMIMILPLEITRSLVITRKFEFLMFWSAVWPEKYMPMKLNWAARDIAFVHIELNQVRTTSRSWLRTKKL